ncbi:hypothetical protein ACGFS9_17005 [Streptomyces sp. NPDC048566]|uniref:hypothetical protein n=1 Tax=Streptomyces sp. NPDC048566 TaxID=3365569 RepID=UPI00371BCFA2
MTGRPLSPALRRPMAALAVGAALLALPACSSATAPAMSASSTTQYFAKTPAHPATYALRLADGGVLAAFPSSYTEETLLKPAYRGAYNINPGDRESIYDSTSRAVITDEFQNQGLAVLAPHGKARVIAAEYRMVDSR